MKNTSQKSRRSADELNRQRGRTERNKINQVRARNRRRAEHPQQEGLVSARMKRRAADRLFQKHLREHGIPATQAINPAPVAAPAITADNQPHHD